MSYLNCQKISFQVINLRKRHFKTKVHSNYKENHKTHNKDINLNIIGNNLGKIGVFLLATALSSFLTYNDASYTLSVENLLFLEAWRAVDRAYVDKKFNDQNWFKLREKYLKNEVMDNREETYMAIKKMLKTLDDPYTKFLDPSEYNVLKKQRKGSSNGIGIGIELGYNNINKSKIQVITSYPDTPAWKAKILPGDFILEINDESLDNKSLIEISDKLLGEENTKIKLKVQTKNEEPRILNLTREKVNFSTVSVSVPEPISDKSGKSGKSVTKCSTGEKVGVIQISRFSDQTPIDKEEVNRYVIDLRNNGGGSFSSGISVAKMWIERGDIVLIADSNGVRDIISTDGEQIIDASTPLLIIVNHGTASAAEILSGALKDNERGTVVGEKTYGKGLIQTIVELSDMSAVIVTTAKYQTPSGIDINKIGIRPNIELSNEILDTLLTFDNVCDFLSKYKSEL